jgi:hypothetical protein
LSVFSIGAKAEVGQDRDVLKHILEHRDVDEALLSTFWLRNVLLMCDSKESFSDVF